MITYHSVTKWLYRVRGTGRRGEGMEAPGWPSAATAWGFCPARHTLTPRHQLGFPFATRLLPLPLLCTSFKKTKERCRPPSHHSQVGPLADVAVRPGGSPGLAPRPNRFRPTAALNLRRRPRGPLWGACARPGPRAATSGALEEVRFRVAAPLRGGPWGLVTRPGVHERPRRRGSPGCPESGRCAGGGRDARRPLLLPVASVCPQSGPDGVAPRRGAVLGC